MGLGLGAVLPLTLWHLLRPLPQARITVSPARAHTRDGEGLCVPEVLLAPETENDSGDRRAVFLRAVSGSTQLASRGGGIVKNADSWAAPRFTNLILG